MPFHPPQAETPLDEYCEERARRHLKYLTDLGVRTVGSYANERGAVDYLLRTAEAIAARAKPSEPPIEVEVHRPSGAFSSSFLDGFTNVYENVSNVLVQVPGVAPDSEQRSVLVNAHFDSALGTEAASDDAVMVATMLEILANLVASPRLPHTVVFNFNGAEETNWMAAHGFITQHRLVRRGRLFVRSVRLGINGVGAF